MKSPALAWVMQDDHHSDLSPRPPSLSPAAAAGSREGGEAPLRVAAPFGAPAGVKRQGVRSIKKEAMLIRIPRLSGKLPLIVILFAAALLATACTPTPGGAPLPTSTSQPTDTPLPTSTLSPTDTPIPTSAGITLEMLRNLTYQDPISNFVFLKTFTLSNGTIPWRKWDQHPGCPPARSRRPRRPERRWHTRRRHRAG